MNLNQQQGFSSEEQKGAQTVQNEKNPVIDQNERQDVRMKALENVNPAQQIKKKQYSLQPDMLTGWKPKSYLPNPIPLIFYNDQLDSSIQALIKMKTYKKQSLEMQIAEFIELVYLGPRYQSTYSAWYQKPFNFPYTHLNKNRRLRFTDRQFVGQYWNAQTQNHLHFDSFFESGNLDVVFKIGQYEYDLFMRVDSNTRGHLQWYNFKIKNMKKSAKYKFNICNFQKGKSLYSRGMKPFTYSKKKHEFTDQEKWAQAGQNIIYEKKTPKSFQICKTDTDSSAKPYQLSFQYVCQYQNDQVQYSYCIPYQYSKLKTYLQQLEQKHSGKKFLKISKLCHSLGGLDIPILTITSNLKEKQPNQQNFNKKIVVASGRIHPGQSNGSYMMEGFIQYLCSQSQESQYLRSSIVFKIIPMINPDGVVLGNYRTSLSGKDLNREFVSPDQYLFPQVYHLKKCIWKLKSTYKKDFLMYLDFHGHSTKKNCFTYGPQFSIINNNYYQCRIFPKLISMQTEMFRYFSCIFKISECKQTTLRAVLLKFFDIDFVYTIEVSNGCYYNHQKLEDVLFDERKWLQMGMFVGKGIAQYLMIWKELHQLKQRKKQERLKLRNNRQRGKIKNSLIKGREINSRSYSRDRQRQILIANNSQILFKGQSDISVSPLKISSFKNKRLTTRSSGSINDKQAEISMIKNQYHENQDFFMFPELKNQKLNSILKSICFQNSKKFPPEQSQNKCNTQDSNFKEQDKFETKSKHSDDNVSEGGSDSSSSSQDLNQDYKRHLFKSIKTGTQKFHSYHLRNIKIRGTRTKMSTSVSQVQKQEELGSHQNYQDSMFMTEMQDSQNQLQELQKVNKINSVKMNQLRSKRHIYLKKKSYQITNGNNLSPKRQNKLNKTAKIINFQFSLQPIRLTNFNWNDNSRGQTPEVLNTIHSFIKQNSQQKLQHKAYKPTPLIQYLTRTSTDLFQQSSCEQQIQSYQRNFLSLQKDPIINFGQSVLKQNSMALLKRRQQNKPIINSTFYKSSKPSKNIEQNVRGKNIFQSKTKRNCLTQVSIEDQSN